jgi:exodeoxyribonuclease V gamma subunit
VRQAEWRRGVLPPSGIGNRILDEVLREVTPLLAASADVRQADATTVDVSVDLPDGRRLAGTVGGVHDTSVVRVTYSRLGPKQRLRAWVQVLALSAGHPQQEWQAATFGKARSNSGYQRSTLGPIAPEEARRLLGDLVDLRERGLREPLPMAVKTSFRYAGTRNRNRPVDVARRDAERDWLTGNFPGEQADREHEIVWGPEQPLDVLLAEPPREDEASWFEEPSRFGAFARRLWTPLLSHERWADE